METYLSAYLFGFSRELAIKRNLVLFHSSLYLLPWHALLMPPKWRLGGEREHKIDSSHYPLVCRSLLVQPPSQRWDNQVPTSQERTCIDDYQLPQGLLRKEEWKKAKGNISLHTQLHHIHTHTHTHTHTAASSITIPMYPGVPTLPRTLWPSGMWTARPRSEIRRWPTWTHRQTHTHTHDRQTDR